jgi:hypothetical protein
MKTHTWLILGLALVLALTLTIGLPGASQAQQSDPAGSYGPAVQGYDSGYYGYNGSRYTGTYCPMGSGYGYYGPARQGHRDYDSRSWSRGHRGARGPGNSGYARGYRGGWGCWRSELITNSRPGLSRSGRLTALFRLRHTDGSLK